jgi:uncharacterized protein (TIGR03084 family)
MTTINDICRDLADEHRSLDEIVSALAPDEWDTPTPAPGWSVRDQISHLAFFDEVAVQAATDPDAFASQLSAIAADPAAYIDVAVQRGREMEPAEVLSWWSEARYRSVEAFAELPPDLRVPWFGPPMKPVSFVTGRLMETWAHGQDIVDGLHVERAPTDRLHHVAHMGVRARGFSFQINGRIPPEGDVLVELRGPSGDTWSWGSSDVDIVSGDALDFCLVVTQRRHPLDTDLRIEGPVAEAWIAIAQSFAGPPGGGRRAGQFPKRAV